MRKSDYGKETTFLWEGVRKTDKIRLIEVPSTLDISPELQERIDAEWKKVKDANPHAFDGTKWRTEFVYDDGDNLDVYVSPIVYSQHNVMRHIENQPIQFYPNPISINTIQVTDDNYIVMGLKGKDSDQRGIGLVGAGFVERISDRKGGYRRPETISHVVQRECLQETRYPKNKDFYADDLRALAVVFGSNHDTTIGFYAPILATSKEVGVNNDEHSDILLLSATGSSISDFLNDGGYKGIKAVDHLLGCLESYHRYAKDNGILK